MVGNQEPSKTTSLFPVKRHAKRLGLESVKSKVQQSAVPPEVTKSTSNTSHIRGHASIQLNVAGRLWIDFDDLDDGDNDADEDADDDLDARSRRKQRSQSGKNLEPIPYNEDVHELFTQGRVWKPEEEAAFNGYMNSIDKGPPKVKRKALGISSSRDQKDSLGHEGEARTKRRRREPALELEVTNAECATSSLDTSDMRLADPTT